MSAAISAGWAPERGAAGGAYCEVGAGCEAGAGREAGAGGEADAGGANDAAAAGGCDDTKGGGAPRVGAGAGG